MGNATLRSKCPVCGEGCTVRANCNPGEPASGLSGPPEYSDPGYGPEIDEMLEIEYDCDCRTSIEENAPWEQRAVMERQNHQAKMRCILFDELDKILRANGFKRRLAAINYTIQRIAGVRTHVQVRNPDGTWAFETVCPMAEAYEEAIYNTAANAEIEFDEWEPDYDDRY